MSWNSRYCGFYFRRSSRNVKGTMPAYSFWFSKVFHLFLLVAIHILIL